MGVIEDRELGGLLVEITDEKAPGGDRDE